MRVADAIMSDIVYLFGQGNVIFIRESRGIMKNYACGNHTA